jgi:predicted GTPase
VRKVVIMGAGGRDFHDFNVVFRNDPDTRVVAFTAAQIPGIDERVYPPELAGPRYPEGIPIVPERELAALIARERVDEVVFAYSDIDHTDVMHRASIVLACGADFRFLGPRATMLRCDRPVVAVCATRTGSGKSPTTRRIGELLLDAGLRVALIRHPMPYGDLARMRVQRFGTPDAIDRAEPTLEEREEYEVPVEMGMVMFAGVDYEAVLGAAAAEADVIVWDGGNNDFSFVEPDLLLVVVDALRAGHELDSHPGEACLRMADVVVVNKVDAAEPSAVEQVVATVGSVNPGAAVMRTASPVSLEPGPELRGARVLVVEDGPTITHGGMPFGAGTVAAREAGAVLVDPRPWAVGSLADAFERFPGIGPVLPAMGYSDAQLQDLGATIRACECDVVVVGTPIALDRLVDLGHPLRRVRYRVEEVGRPDFADVLAPVVAAARWRRDQDG